jgi:Na+/proline symporter
MIASFVVSSVCFVMVPNYFEKGDPNSDATIMLVTVIVSTVIWITVTFMTQPEPAAILDSFYKRVRPGGPGWTRIAERNGFGAEGIEGGVMPWTNWIAGIVAVYCSLFGIGKIVFGEHMMGIILLAIAFGALVWISRSFRGAAGLPSTRISS